MIFFAQFRKDFKSFLNEEKTMAHRKQIKVSKSEKTSVKTKTVKSQNEPRKNKSQAEPQYDQELEPGPSTDLEPQQGQSTDLTFPSYS